MTMRLFLLQPDVVFSAQVNQAEFVYPIWQVTWDGTISGSYTNVKANMTVLFGSSAGADDLGRQRTISAADTTKLYFGRSSKGVKDGEVNLSDNVYITVLDDYRVWAKVPYIDAAGTIAKDGIFTYGDQNENIPPKANGGTGFAATIDSVTSKITVDFDSAASYGLVNSISTISWDVDDGTITVGTSASAAITATFPAGFRWVRLTVIDSVANSHTTAIPVYARDPASDTTVGAFEIERHPIRKDGQEMSFKILSDIAESTYPDGTLVMLWEDEPSSSSDRSHMRFTGWHHTDPAQISAGKTGILRGVTFDCLDVAGKLKTIPGFPISIEGNAAPSSWLEMANPNMDRYIDHILRWHSTAFEVAPFTLSGTGSSYPFVILGSDAGSIWEQAARRAQSLVPDYILTCNTKGQIAIKPDPMIQATADRTATVQVALTESDWSDIRYSHERPPRVHWLRSDAVLASASTIAAMFCVAPDNTPGQGTSEQTHGEQLAISQDNLNTAEGNRYARLNAEETFFNITLAEGSDQSIEPASMTWVTMVISASTAAQRGLTLSTARGLVHEINISYRHERTGLTKTAVLTWERETSGTAATTYIPPATNIDIDYEPPAYSGYSPDQVPSNASDGLGKVYVMDDSKLYKTDDFSAASPTWDDITGLAAGDELHDWILDPYRPTTTGFLLTSGGVYKFTDLDTATPTVTQKLTVAAFLTGASSASGFYAWKIIGSINQDGYFAFVATTEDGGSGNWYASDEIWCVYTSDSGDNWSYVQIYATADNSVYHKGGFDYVPHLVSGAIRMYCCFVNNAVFSSTLLYRSDNGGASWSQVFSTGGQGGGSLAGGTVIHCPYKNNEDGNSVYWGLEPASSVNTTYRSTNGGGDSASIDLQSIESGGGNGGTFSSRTGVESYTQDNNLVYIWQGNNIDYFLKSIDGGTSFSKQPTSGLNTGPVRASGGFPYNGSQFYALTDGGVFVSTDAGDSFVDKTGDIVSLSFSEGIGAIVPVWVE